MLPLPPARTPDNGALQRQTLQAGRGRAAIRLQTTGRRSPVYLAPEDSARPVQPAGFFFAAKPDKGRTGMEGAGESRRGYRATCLGAPQGPRHEVVYSRTKAPQ